MLGYRDKWKYGAGRYAENLVKHLNDLGVTVRVFTVGVGMNKIGTPLFWVRGALKNFGSFDIVHSSECAGIFVRHPHKVEVCHMPHWRYPTWSHRVLTAFQLRASKRAKITVVPSYYSARELRLRLPASSQVEVIHHGVDQRIFHSSPSERRKTRASLGVEDSFVALCVGRLVSHKRQGDIIRALEKVPNAVLVIVGRGPFKDRLIAEARQLDVELLLFSQVSDDFLRALYNAADVYVHPSRLEGFGFVVFEAMSCGLPIIAVKSADLERAVGPAGFIVSPQKEDALQEPLMILAGDKRMRRRMSKLALSRSSGFDWGKTARKHVHLFERLLEEE